MGGLEKGSSDPKPIAMLQKLQSDGLLDVVTDGRPPNARAFTKPKSESKGALIVEGVCSSGAKGNEKVRVKGGAWCVAACSMYPPGGSRALRAPAHGQRTRGPCGGKRRTLVEFQDEPQSFLYVSSWSPSCAHSAR